MKQFCQSLCFQRNNRLFSTCSIFCLLLLTSGVAKADELLVAVASNFIKPMQAISQSFTKATGHTLKLSFGSSGKLMAQISHGAPFDVFLSADKDKVMRLLKSNLATSGSEFIYAQGRLVLWSAKADFVDNAGEVLTKSDFRYIALADAKLAPYGKAAEQVISHLKLSDHLKKRIVQGENISQAYQFVRTGNAELGFIALSQLRQHTENMKGSHWLIPQTYHQPIEQFAVTLKRADTKLAAKALKDFLQKDSTHALIRSFGYGLPAQISAKNYADLR